jgi:hypothetical protein
MSIHVFPPPAIDETEYSQIIEPARAKDLLAQAIAHIRPHLDQPLSIHYRVRAFWAGAAAARRMNVAVWDVIEDEFRELARFTRLTADLGRYGGRHNGQQDVDHIIRWTRFSPHSPF